MKINHNDNVRVANIGTMEEGSREREAMGSIVDAG